MTHSNLITVFSGNIQHQSIQLCNARSLHEFLAVKNHFKDWITDRITDYGFTENEDYIIVTERTAGRPRKEYHITLDMGKELAMVERNEKGRQIRKYFIEVEKKNRQPQQPALSEPPKTYTRTLTEEQWLGFASLWYCLYNCVELLDKIEKPLNALRSPLGIDARTHVQEYHISLGISKRLLAPLLAEFDVDPRERHYFHALKTLREYKPFGVGKLARV